MAKHLEKFTKPFQESRIPFLLTEVITDGEGNMVDLVCRFANAPAAALLGDTPQALRGRRFTRVYPPERLETLAPLAAVAFSGSCASFACQTAAGTALQVVCYQVMYGVAGCLLEAREGPVADTPALPPDAFPCAACVLELSRRGLRCLSFNQHLGALTGWGQRQLYDRFARDFSALICPEDWPELLQALLDADREKLPLRQEVRLSCRDGSEVWVDFRARRSTEPGVFCVLLPEIQPARQHHEQMKYQQSLLEETRRALEGLLHTLPGAFLLARRGPDGPTEVTAVSDRLAQLLELEVPELTEQLRSDPLGFIPPQYREELQSALIRSRVTLLPLRQLCPVRTGSGKLLQLSLEGVWQPVGQEEWALYLTLSLIHIFEKLAEDMGKTVTEIKNIISALHEFNPMMGHRGCRLAVTYPEIAAMQTRAVIKAALAVQARHPEWTMVPEIMIPLVGEVKELAYVKKIVVETADEIIKAAGSNMKYLVGTMIEIPRAALTADEIAKEADFFSFGTNDLTQMTFGFSRDDAGKFLDAYYDKKIYENDPFAKLDQKGVGKLVDMACKLGRSVNPDLHLGICGEHGGDPSSVEFCHRTGLDYVSCSPFRVPIARLAAAQAAIKEGK